MASIDSFLQFFTGTLIKVQNKETGDQSKEEGSFCRVKEIHRIS